MGSVALAMALAFLSLACTGGKQGSPDLPGLPGEGTVGLATCNELAKAKRFRYNFEYKLESPKPSGDTDASAVGNPPFVLRPNDPDFLIAQTIEGSFVEPDKFSLSIKTPGQADLPTVYIGERRWAKLGDSWAESESSTLGPPFPPLMVCLSALTGLEFDAVTPAEEELNGLAVRHYSFGQITLENMATALWGSESDMGRLLKVHDVEVWLTEDGSLARLETRSQGTYPSGRKLLLEQALDIKDVNAGDIEVEPPI